MARRFPASLSLAVLSGATAIAMVAAVSVPANADDNSSRLAKKEHHACAHVLGLNPSEAPYQTCVENLDRSLAAAGDEPPDDATTPIERVPRACTAVGLKPGTPAYDDCVTDLGESLTDEDGIYR